MIQATRGLVALLLKNMGVLQQRVRGRGRERLAGRTTKTRSAAHEKEHRV
jgi:hypothetical protein